MDAWGEGGNQMGQGGKWQVNKEGIKEKEEGRRKKRYSTNWGLGSKKGVREKENLIARKGRTISKGARGDGSV